MKKTVTSLFPIALLALFVAACSGVGNGGGGGGGGGANATNATNAERLPPVKAVDRVDISRYLGRWYEIASYPMYFQRKCIGDTTANYSLRPDGELTVLNRCRTVDGFEQASGHAWPVDNGANARLKVSFFWPFRADYWVIGLDDNYRWAVVGNPNREYLWVLSRTPVLAPQDLARALDAVKAQGYEPARLRYTRQAGQ
jgi:apolipoprotein D and lipocalin family protein